MNGSKFTYGCSKSINNGVTQVKVLKSLKMKDIYVTLVSDVTADYSANVANQFKIKPKLRLPGEGWKVSIQSAILPRMALFKDLQTETWNLIELWYDASDGHRKKTWLHGLDLKFLENLYKCRTGIDFMNEIKLMLDERRTFRIPSGTKILDSQWIKLEWKRENGEPELLMHHSNPGTFIKILRKFAKSMHWINPANYNDGHMGMNIVFSYPSNTRETSDLDINAAHKMDATWVFLSSKVDFQFINLNQAFADALNLHTRPLTVTAKVTANKETVTQSLGQVYYAPEGRERYLFTPPVEEFYEVQTMQWEEVEISLKELDDNLVNFQTNSQCLIRLHFKKD